MGVAGRVVVATLRAILWSSLAAGGITVVLRLRTAPELPDGIHVVATWFGLCFVLAFAPSLAMELGLTHLLLEFGAERPAQDRLHAKRSEDGVNDEPPNDRMQA